MTETPFSDLQTLPSWQLGRAGALAHRLVAGALAEEGCRMGHHAVLCAVAEFGPVAQAELARRVRIDPKDMVGVLRELGAKGLVLREKDPRDARKNAISLSPTGARLLTRLAALGARANAELLAPLAPAEREQLLALVARLIEDRA
ncbi:MarR family winged helix-turn-helix transcriptional regulator [Kitasatospora sp. NBC_01287]|uniref:MarR family winged helix-turn-helix transcriptional regulator n=1 Tax=Kitasatospora sp. NBC_01287 TaxID=2903573 RepID=UPI002251034F|nr:MarR family winged helix-turn-helix transcriptional regulator [Kitasatospora sp. NBC_01287]MCX4745099.1 MarR family winged helix-turn-helix transcriptional regulator [Kitasatospora sp. NBC_01287]